VGPGTGIAPFRSYLWDKNEIRGRNEERGDVLFTGCRNKLGDFLYASELGELEQEGVVVHAAFSRDSPQGKGKVYVQDLIREHSEQVWEVISKGGGVYVAGASGGMPKSVREAIEWVATTVGGVPDAKGYVDGMVRGGLYKEEVW
jgi:sulfite reductase alpha subunit-like flavoprotein